MAQLPQFPQGIRFLIIGAIATLIHAGIFSVAVVKYLMPALLANTLAFGLAFIFAFTGHRFWTFAAHATSATALHSYMVRFAGVATLGYLINSVIAMLVLDYAQYPFWAALGLMALLTPLVVFVLLKYWVFVGPEVDLDIDL